MPTRGNPGDAFLCDRDAARVQRQGPIGVTGEAASPISDPPALPAQQRTRSPAGFGAPFARERRGRRGRARSKPKVLTLLGAFPNPWQRLADEVDRIKKGSWSPGVDDFHAVSGRRNVVTCPSFHQMLATIQAFPPGGVRRVDVFTHASRGSIAFQGTIAARTGNVSLNHGSALHDNSLQAARRLVFRSGKGSFRLADVGSRFAPGAQLVLYACNSGVDTLLLQQVANALGVSVLGFSAAIAYCPKFTTNPLKIDRRWIGVGNCSKATTDVSSLRPDRRCSPRPFRAKP